VLRANAHLFSRGAADRAADLLNRHEDGDEGHYVLLLDENTYAVERALMSWDRHKDATAGEALAAAIRTLLTLEAS
jgi:hypothetical protein